MVIFLFVIATTRIGRDVLLCRATYRPMHKGILKQHSMTRRYVNLYDYTVTSTLQFLILDTERWGMAEFCSSCCVMDTVRHHAKACSHFCFIFWLSASFSLSQKFGNEYKYIFNTAHESTITQGCDMKIEMRKAPHAIVFMTLFFYIHSSKESASLMCPVLWHFLFVWWEWNKDGSDQENKNEYFVF